MAGKKQKQKPFPKYSLIFDTIKLGKYSEFLSCLDTIVDINERCGRSLKTPLHFAAIYRRPEFLELLLTNGASLYVEDKYGLTTIQWMEKHNFWEALPAIRKAVKGRTPTPDDIAKYWAHCRRGNLDSLIKYEFLKFMIEVNIDLNLRDEEGKDALYRTIIRNRKSLKLATILLRILPEPIWRNEEGCNILHETAAMNLQLENDLIMRRFPELANLRDNRGNLPIRYFYSTTTKHTSNSLRFCEFTTDDPGLVLEGLITLSKPRKKVNWNPVMFEEISKRITCSSEFPLYRNLNHFIEKYNEISKKSYFDPVDPHMGWFWRMVYRRDLILFLWVLKNTEGFGVPKDIVDALMVYFDFASVNDRQQTNYNYIYPLIFTAVKLGRFSEFMSCLEFTENLNERCGRSLKSLLHFAVIYHRKDCMERSLNRGASLDIVDKFGETPIDFIMKHKFWEAVPIIKKYVKGRPPTQEDIDDYWNHCREGWWRDTKDTIFLRFIVEVDIDLQMTNQFEKDGLCVSMTWPKNRSRITYIMMKIQSESRWRDSTTGRNILHEMVIQGSDFKMGLVLRRFPELANLRDNYGDLPINYFPSMSGRYMPNTLRHCEATTDHPKDVLEVLITTSKLHRRSNKWNALKFDEIRKRIALHTDFPLYRDLIHFTELLKKYEKKPKFDPVDRKMHRHIFLEFHMT
ncbi:hypothetical protein HK098_000919 [Nowakowskiella sp. JEL0407]|nr:hypothetical protein HK098_000919 [Nowakowskiella sp. JEL0407]